MKHPTVLFTTLFALLLAARPLPAAQTAGFGLDVLLDGVPRTEYPGRGQLYIEAVRGREYALRITNPLPVRVAVALAVDGLNTIDARHGDAAGASKWVLGPYQTIEISGWQVNGQEARRFFFTGERHSYGAWLGKTADLGVIEAVFYRERCRPAPVLQPWVGRREQQAPSARAEGVPAPPAEGPSRDAAASKAAPSPSDEYAATGIGERNWHEVRRVQLDLDPTPAAVVRIHYEFRPQLVELGLLPPLPVPYSPLDRREHARGFAGSYCPDPQ
ncbi:MAG: hypothetical protein ACM3O7_05840 [Acidobacteriota bacterium]